MKPARWLWVFGALVLFFAMPARAGLEYSQTYVLFGGENKADSSERRSRTIPIRGANRIVIRLWSANTAAYTGADSIYTDSLSVVKYLFSDSVSTIVRDSLGTLVTLGPYTSATDVASAFPLTADSVAITPTATNTSVADTANKMVVVHWSPLLKKLRPAVNGSGVYTLVDAALPLVGTSVYGDGTLMPQYFWMRATPVTRFGFAGTGSDVGNVMTNAPASMRTRGINGLRGTATVYYRDR